MSRYSSSNPFATTHSDSDSDSLSCIVTDLFESRSSSSPDHSPHCSCNDININPFSDVVCEEHALELGLGFGDEIESQNNDNYDAVFDFGDSGGLTVTRFGSDSDSGGEEEEFEPQRNDDVDDDDEEDDDIDVHLCWDSFCLEDHRSINEWEDVLEERLNEIDEVEAEVEVDIEVDGESESVASGFEDPDPDPGEEAFGYPEWEILLAVNNLERNVELEYEEEDENIADLYLAIHDGFISTTEYDVLFGQLLENDSAMKGSPPAAKSFMENLPLVELTKEELRGKDVACAICKDDIMLEEKVRRLPCSHCYHGDCIMPWLNMRNTCPVCRFELPTDDADYEESKIHRAARGLLELAATHM